LGDEDDADEQARVPTEANLQGISGFDEKTRCEREEDDRFKGAKGNDCKIAELREY
jgi:hypothetical protein